MARTVLVQCASNVDVYSELVRYVLSIDRYVKIFKYRFEVIHSKENILGGVYKTDL
jgi:hypothetical protein